MRVQTSDGSGGTHDKIFTITVADNVAPVFDVAPATANVTTDGFDITASLNEAGTVLYVIVPRNAAAPSVAQVLAGQDASGSAALGRHVRDTPVGGRNHSRFGLPATAAGVSLPGMQASRIAAAPSIARLRR